MWLCLNCGSVEWHLRGEGKAILCECVAGVWTTMEQVWPAPWISVEERLPWDDEGNENEREIYWLVYVVTPGKCFWTLDYYVDGIWETYGEYVTHWQPGPSAPE